MRDVEWNQGKRLKADVPAEVREELDFHLTMRARELEVAGLSPAEARRQALERMGDIGTVTEACRQLGQSRERRMSFTRFTAELGQDVRHAVRQFVRSPRFTLVTVLTLGLGIGATTAIFSAVYGILLRPLAYPEPDRLVVPRSEDRLTGNRWNVTYLDYLDWREAGVFAHVGIWWLTSVNAVNEGEPERVPTALVTEDFFAAVGMPPLLGRPPGPESFAPGAARVAVLSYGLWQRAFGGDRSAIGKTLMITGVPTEVAAVLPPEFELPGDVDLWLPFRETPADSDQLAERDNYIFFAVARMAADQTLEQVRARLGTLARRVEDDNPKERANVTVTAEPLVAWLVGADTRRMLWVLLGAVGFVLLIGCVNVANLLLGRSVARGRELAIRGAIGAGRGRLARQLLTESAVLGLMGGVLGVALADAGVRLLVAFAPPGVPRLDLVTLSGPALAFALVVSLLAALLFGLLPALRVSRSAGTSAFSGEELRGSTGVRGRRMLQLLVGGELALSLLLLIGAGLFTRSFLRLLNSSPGFEPDRLLTFAVALQGPRYTERGAIGRTFPELVRQLGALPGVTAASAATSLPVGGGGFYLGRSFLPEGRPEPPDGEEVSAMWNVVLPGFFQTIGIPMLRGREFRPDDDTASVPAMIVSRLFARRMFSTEDVIGRRVRSWRDENRLREIVGVVDDVRFFSAGDSLRPLVYVPHAQDAWGQMVVVLRTAGDPVALAPAARHVVRSIDPGIAPANVRSMETVVQESRAPERAGAFLMLVFAVIALVLAVVGIYGVLSYLVAHRTNEIGIRMALGAARSSVITMVLREALVLVLLGTASGLAGAIALSRSISALLFEVGATDRLVFTAVPLLLGLVAMAASWAPARRASRVDPMTAIRN